MQGRITLQRRNAQTAVQDDLTYEYNTGTNRLRNTNTADGQNYTYDEIGNLISDNAEGIDSIAWTPYGKVRKVEKTNNSSVSFRYDASGNRIVKIASGDTTVYVRDASGNVMGIYKNDTLVEQSINGSSRLGLMTFASKTGYRTLGGKKYELSNHLGNVLAVVTDNINFDQDSTWATVVNMTDYYPFGLAMEGRSLQDSSYRYGFNGMEKDDEVKGSGRTYTALYRQNDVRLGRWSSVDPKTKFLPGQSPYTSMDNNPIGKIDPKGDCITCPTMVVGGVIGIGVGLYDLSQQHGGGVNAIKKLAEGDGKAWIHLSTTTGTGVALGSGVGLLGSVGIAAGSNLLDQTVQKDIYLDGDFSKLDPVETAVAGSFAILGIGGGKIVDKLLKPVTSKGTALSPFLEKTTFPKNSPATVIGANLGLGAASAVGEKATTYLSKEFLKKEETNNSKSENPLK